MGHCLLSLIPFFLSSLIEYAAHLERLDTRNASFCRPFLQLRRRSDMTACEWETREIPEGAFGKHAFLLREKHECIQAGRKHCLPMMLLWSWGSLFNVVLNLISLQFSTNLVKNTCQINVHEPNQCSFQGVNVLFLGERPFIWLPLFQQKPSN